MGDLLLFLISYSVNLVTITAVNVPVLADQTSNSLFLVLFSII